MEWVLWMFAVLVLGAGAVVASGRWGSMPGTERDVPHPDLPETPLTGDDLRRVRFEVSARGYSMAQVDEVLDRLAAELDADRGFTTPYATDVSDGSAIMGPDEFSRQEERENHGSNEAPHG